MADIHGQVTTNQSIGGKVNVTSAVNGGMDKNVRDRLYRNYNLLYNKPMIDGVELEGDKSLEDLGIMRWRFGTTEYWNSDPSLLSDFGTVYVYTDCFTVDDTPVPNFKIGDGTSYLIDQPFVSAKMDEHIEDQVRHITDAERQKWNNKVSVALSPSDPENLMFITG